MNILIATASKHGATTAIAESVAEILRGHGHEVAVRSPADIESVDEYDAFVLGSAVYAGRWRKSIRDFVRNFGNEISPRPVWLFSSGPVGSTPKPEDAPSDVAAVAHTTGAREHHVFAGALDRDQLSHSERAIVKLVRAPYGDFRGWNEIRAWAEMIAAELGDVARTPVASSN